MTREDEKRLNTLSPFEVKNTLMQLAHDRDEKSMINAGRGNPNWVATTPREAFFRLGLFALEESEPMFEEYSGYGGVPKKDGIAGRLKAFIARDSKNAGLILLDKSLAYVTTELNMDEDSFVIEMVEGILADNYPVPDRILALTEKIVHAYLMKEMNAGDFPAPEGKFEIFATEGGTAAMVYIFNSLKANRLLNKGDKIAIAAPTFTPYIEIPELEDYQFDTVEIMADKGLAWQISDEEIDKLRDPSIKAFFLVNPSNPASVKIEDKTLKRIADIIKERPDLILLTDDVYGTFTNKFTSLAMIAPKNTILVYSYSKFYGATGWRLGYIAMHEDNVLDEMIRNHPQEIKDELNKRYSSLSLEPANIKLIDRFVADSRAVALNHTAGISTPQQIQMAFFSLMSLVDKQDSYKRSCQTIVKNRYEALIKATKVDPIIQLDNEDAAFYYVEVDYIRIAKQTLGEDFCTWLMANHEPLDFILRMAEDKGVVLMPGGGFDAPEWTFRISLANLHGKDYAKITEKAYELLDDYNKEFKA